jgi:hypothetical protein
MIQYRLLGSLPTVRMGFCITSLHLKGLELIYSLLQTEYFRNINKHGG